MTTAGRILIVDDDPDIVVAMRTALEAHGYHVLSAANGDDGLALALEQVPDLLIVDMLMPGCSGFRVLEQVRQRRGPRVKVMMMTATAGQAHQRYAEWLGTAAYIRKPFPLGKMLDVVDDLVSRETVSA
jgi:DNA-binding response OmpR family regulator